MKITRPQLAAAGLLVLVSFVLGAFTFAKWQNTPINHSMVQQAAALIGLEFTSSEIDTMLSGLENFRGNYESNRQRPVPNSLTPALVFNPLPAGLELERGQRDIRYSNPGKVALPANRDELAHFSVRQLAELIRSQQISSVELTQFYLDRLKKYDPTLKCVITLTEERALATAKKADQEIAAGRYRGLLHGIPYGAKDLLSTKDYKTTWGATPYQEQMIPEDAVVIEKLEQAGAVLVAKLTLGALAWGDVWYGGMTRNPWDTSRGSSGSSAGSASAVSAGLVPFAIGTETLGSIVSPSTVCGTTGLRPTFGRVSRTGAMALSWTMDKIGPICRTVEDCAIVFAAINGPDPKDPALIAAPFNYDAELDVKQLRVAYVKSDFEGAYPFKSQDSLVLAKLAALGLELIPIELPDYPDIGFILESEAAAAFDELTRSGRDDELVRQIKFAWPNVFRQARMIPAVEYIQANRIRRQLMEEMHNTLHNIDLYIAPSWASSSLRITNFTGHPCVVLPNGFRDGRPTSITFTGKLFGEDKLLRFAKFFQDNTDFHLQHPELNN
ncbi:MAG: amidase [Bacteroidota bacterium]